MKQTDYAVLALPPDWKPETLALRIEAEAAAWWDKGWVFVESKVDALMENVVLQFERETGFENLGAIFDWDGVVIDSSAHHEESWERLARECRMPLPAGHFKRGFGMKNEWIIPKLLQWTQEPAEITRLSLRKEELYRDVIRERGIAPLPGVRDLLDLLAASGIPAVIGSSTHRLNITTTLKALDLGHRFAAICSAEDVDRGKPDPQIFLLAARAIQRPPEFCVVFEDAQVGIDAARAGGMKAVGVATTHPLGTLKGVHREVERLTAVDRPFLQALWGLA